VQDILGRVVDAHDRNDGVVAEQRHEEAFNHRAVQKVERRFHCRQNGRHRLAAQNRGGNLNE